VLEAAACLQKSFAMASAPWLLKLMTSGSVCGEVLRSVYRLIHSSGRAIKSPIRRYRHKHDMPSIEAALAL